jgi:oligopeptide/dipeptide ABC transporter ATP-binding protein
MYLGRIVEIGDCDRLYVDPRHPYTQALLSAVPVPNPSGVSQRIILKGDVPSPMSPPPGCHFHTRCPHAMERCKLEVPLLRDTGNGHQVACHLDPS